MFHHKEACNTGAPNAKFGICVYAYLFFVGGGGGWGVLFMSNELLCPKIDITMCDEWGGAESRGNGARPVEWMIMNDTCATHRSRVPRRSFGRNKRRSDDIGRGERTRPGFYFVFCVRGSPSRTTAAHTKHKIKPRPGPLSSSNVVTPPFIPSEAPPWDSRPVSGAGVVHYHSLHRPRSVPTALGPAPLVTPCLLNIETI